MSKIEQIQSKLVEYQKAKDTDSTSTLRLLLSELKNYAIDTKKSITELSDQEVDKVLSKQAKQRVDSIDAFKKANRQDLVDKEQKELDIINSYLPKKLTGKDLEQAVEHALSKTNAKSKAQMGDVMKALSQEYGSKLDMSEASKLVLQRLP